MTQQWHSAPHIRHQESARILMGDAILTMACIYVMAFYYYGLRAVVLCGVSVVASVLCDIACTLLLGRRPNLRDFSSIVTGMMIPLLLPATVPYSTVVVAAVFGIAVAKQPFGGVGNNVFNPAAAGVAFVSICFGEALFLYPVPGETLPLWGAFEGTLLNSPAFTLALGGVPKYDVVEMALGNYPGPMGATNILVILACLLYLVFRNTVRWQVPVLFYLTTSLLAFTFPRLGLGLDLQLTFAMRMQSVAFEMMSGVLLFGGIFMLGDPVTTPKRGSAKIAFGIVAGVVVMLFRRYGNMEEEFTFALLLLNASVWGFDMLGEQISSRIRRRQIEGIGGKAIQKKA